MKPCDNPRCRNPTAKAVSVSTKRPADGTRHLCSACEEAYTWGVQHGRFSAAMGRIWTAVVVYKGLIELVQPCVNASDAQRAIVEHLQKAHHYPGPASFGEASAWVAERADRFTVEIVEHPLPVGLEELSMGAVEQFLKKQAFIVLTHNPSNEPAARFEAWAYEGPLDFEEAGPVRFGLGRDPVAALWALNDQLR
jgi:hypothetical protein